VKTIDAAPIVPIADVVERTVVKVRGRIVSIQVEPAGNAPTLTARVQDESGRIDAVFMGRRAVPGIEPGQHITLEGRACATSSLMRFYNPRYELQCHV
jgi:RecJ-like exonuclease